MSEILASYHCLHSLARNSENLYPRVFSLDSLRFCNGHATFHDGGFRRLQGMGISKRLRGLQRRQRVGMVRKFRESLLALQKDDRPPATVVGDSKNVDHPAAGDGSWGACRSRLAIRSKGRSEDRVADFATGLRRRERRSRREDLDGRSPRAARTVARPEFREYFPPLNEVPMAEFGELQPSTPSKFRESLPLQSEQNL